MESPADVREAKLNEERKARALAAVSLNHARRFLHVHTMLQGQVPSSILPRSMLEQWCFKERDGLIGEANNSLNSFDSISSLSISLDFVQ